MFEKFSTLLLKYNAYVPGSLDMRSHFCGQDIRSNLSKVMFFFLVSMYILCSNSVHLVSVADRDINSVGIPSCHIIAMSSFFLDSK